MMLLFSSFSKVQFLLMLHAVCVGTALGDPMLKGKLESDSGSSLTSPLLPQNESMYSKHGVDPYKNHLFHYYYPPLKNPKFEVLERWKPEGVVHPEALCHVGVTDNLAPATTELKKERRKMVREMFFLKMRQLFLAARHQSQFDEDVHFLQHDKPPYKEYWDVSTELGSMHPKAQKMDEKTIANKFTSISHYTDPTTHPHCAKNFRDPFKLMQQGDQLMSFAKHVGLKVNDWNARRVTNEEYKKMLEQSTSSSSTPSPS